MVWLEAGKTQEQYHDVGVDGLEEIAAATVSSAATDVAVCAAPNSLAVQLHTDTYRY